MAGVNMANVVAQSAQRRDPGPKADFVGRICEA
jgi:hypothetical protein